jgi:WD repeat-containing protein 35
VNGVHIFCCALPFSDRVLFAFCFFVFSALYRGFFAGTSLVYAFNKPERAENCVCFWDTSTDERHIKYVKSLISIRASGENCVFATKTDDGSGQFILILCNAIGSPVDSKYIDIEPLFITMTPYHVIVASNELVYIWQYRTPVTKLTSIGGTGVASGTGSATSPTTAAAAAANLKRKEGRETVFHIDFPVDKVSPNNPTALAAAIQPLPGVVTTGVNKASTNDPICCICASNTTLIISRSSGTLLRFTLPHLTLEHKYIVRCRPALISLNCDSTRLSIIDINGVLTLFDLDARPPVPANTTSGPLGQKGGAGGAQPQQQLGVHLDFERKDTWDMMWSSDNPELFACMEKTRMYIFRGIYAEEPVQSSGYLCSFNDLCIKAVLLDDIVQDPEHPDKEYLVNFETKSLRDTRQLLETVPISEAFQFVEDNKHPRLWRILAESALEQLNFLIADKAFVHCSDYQGIQFVKKLKLLNDRNKQRAEVAAYFRRFDEAETLYLQMDCKELAVELRTRLGDWFRVVQLIQSGAGDDNLLNEAYNHIGDYYADRQKWVKGT